MSLTWGNSAEAASLQHDTGISASVEAVGWYDNWDGVSNVAQFRGADGNLWFAVDSEQTVTVYKTDGNGNICAGSVSLSKQHPTFGTALCDGAGNFYLVTGEENPTDNRTVETIFISKYDASGKLLGTVGDNGSSGLAYYYGDGFYTKEPFHGGTCDAAISGNLLSVHYGRLMYSGHQSNSVFTVDIRDLSKVSVNPFYESHSFAQRVVPTANGFVYMSEGDCYDRVFKVYAVEMNGTEIVRTKESGTFDFWVEDGALDRFDMWQVNENYAHMGGIAALSGGKVAFAATSGKSLSQSVQTESEEIFIQIFDPFADLSTPNAYVTSGTRSGLGGPNGRDEVTNYGVKWLTDLGNDYSIENVQIVSTEDHRIVVLYELFGTRVYDDGEGNQYYRRGAYQGLYYIVLDESGNVVKSATLFAEKARLNPCKTPVCSGGRILWVGNATDSASKLYVYVLDPTANPTSSESQTSESRASENQGTSASQTTAGGPDRIDGLHLGWYDYEGKSYWYENGIKQGTVNDKQGVLGDGSVRGREICDPACDGWFWLDSVYGGAKAVGKEVWIPYIYQDENTWDEAKKREIANESDHGMEDLVYDYMTNKTGKWVRYDENGAMCKGWVKIEGALAEQYPKQAGNVYYYDTRTGLMAKGRIVLDGVEYFFNETTGVMEY